MIKIERPEGDFARGYDRVAHGESAYFVWLNRGKESIALDLKQPDDRALLRRLVARADVFIQNLAPGAAGRLGFDSAALRAADPKLVTCDISGYGETGAYAGMKAYDLLVQAESGLASVTGRPEGPGRVGVSVCDIACGLYATLAIFEALIGRQKSGEGRALKVSLFDAMADWMNVPLLHQVYGGRAPDRVGLNHPSIAPYGAYEARDGAVLISIQNEREWRRFCAQVLEKPALAEDARFRDNPARVANRPALDREIAAVFGALDRGRAHRTPGRRRDRLRRPQQPGRPGPAPAAAAGSGRQPRRPDRAGRAAGAGGRRGAGAGSRAGPRPTRSGHSQGVSSMSVELEAWRRWIGRTETKHDRIDPPRAQALQRLVEDPEALLEEGATLPPLWHWLYFWSVARHSDLGPDGHAARGGLVPPITLPTRMWAGSRLAFARPLMIGSQAEKVSTVADVVEKQGRSGRLVFVTLHHQVSDDAGVCIEEEHDIVYRHPTGGGAPASSEPAPAVTPWRLPVTPDPVMLFRYSALTMNGHRIHYDRKYCTEVEGFPGLVVHGPLLATLMMELVRRNAPGATARGFDFRAFSTIFDTAPFTVGGKPSPDGAGAELWIADKGGRLAMHGSVELA